MGRSKRPGRRPKSIELSLRWEFVRAQLGFSVEEFTTVFGARAATPPLLLQELLAVLAGALGRLPTRLARGNWGLQIRYDVERGGALFALERLSAEAARISSLPMNAETLRLARTILLPPEPTRGDSRRR